jgi:SNF2-related domain/Helicase conserved C-terminal domain
VSLNFNISPKHRVVGIPMRQDLYNLIPNPKTVTVAGKDLLVVPHGEAETRLLRNMGYPVPAPVAVQYDWEGGDPFETQVKTVSMLTMNKRAYVLNSMGCVDADTEYLSPTGWKRIADYTSGDVAQYHPSSGEIEFVPPTEFVKLPCPEMIRFKTTRGVDQLLSPEHRVLLASGKVLSAEDVETSYGSRSSKDFKFRTTFTVRNAPGLTMTDAEIRLQVAVNADGYARNDWNKVVVRLKKTRKIERLRQLLTCVGIPYKEVPCAPTGFVRFTFVPPAVKGFYAAWWGASQAQLEIVADECVHWDGSERKAGGKAFSSFTKADADFVQYALSASGRRASLTARPNKGGTEHVVYAKAGSPAVGLYGINGGQVAQNVWRELSPDGFKYCFMVPSTFLLLRRNGMIFATGNTGKTKAALWAWKYLYRRGLAKKLLIVAPLSTLNFTWGGEILRTLPGVKFQILYGDKARRLKRLADTDADIYIINHDGVNVMKQELMARKDIDTLVIDELATYRKGNTVRHRVMLKLVERMQWAWGMTGSPTPREPTDAWAQCRLLTPNTVPKFFNRFRDDTMHKITQFTYVPKPNALDKVFEAMQPAVRFTLSDVVELPDLVERTVDVPLGPRQKKVYTEMAAAARVLIEKNEITAMNAGAVLGKLLQISCGYIYTRDKKVVELDNEGRMQALADAIEASERKVIVFVPFVHALQSVAARLRADDHEVGVVYGGTPKGERDEIFNVFQNTDKMKVIVAHPRTMAHGLTLTAANTVVWFAPTSDLEIFEQANARVRRYGQKHKQLILMFAATAAERKIYTKLRAKQKVQNSLLELFAEGTD